MASGKQLGDAAYQRYLLWESSLSEIDLEVLTRNGILNRTKCAKNFGCDRSVFRTNTRVVEAFNVLESKLVRERSRTVERIVRQSDEKFSSDHVNEKLRQEINKLEQENFKLQLIVNQSRKSNQSLAELSETIAELGIII